MEWQDNNKEEWKGGGLECRRGQFRSSIGHVTHPEGTFRDRRYLPTCSGPGIASLVRGISHGQIMVIIALLLKTKLIVVDVTLNIEFWDEVLKKSAVLSGHDRQWLRIS